MKENYERQEVEKRSTGKASSFSKQTLSQKQNESVLSSYAYNVSKQSSGIYGQAPIQAVSSQSTSTLTFHEQGPNFRHSWTEGENAPHLESYRKEKGATGATMSQSVRIPQRKTGVLYTEHPNLNLAEGGVLQSFSQSQSKSMGSTISMERIQTTSQPQVFYTSETRQQPRKVGEASSHQGSYEQSRTEHSHYEESKKPSKDRSESQRKQWQYAPAGSLRERFSRDDSMDSDQQPLIISGAGLPEGTKRFVVDKFTVTFTEKDEEDTLI